MSQAAVSGPAAWAWVSDLFLRGKVEGLARESGLSARFFGTPRTLVDALVLGEARPTIVLVDLGDRAGQGFVLLEELARLRAEGAEGPEGAPGVPPVLAFYSHVEAETRARALALGATRVVPRSAFVSRFGALVRELTGQ